MTTPPWDPNALMQQADPIVYGEDADDAAHAIREVAAIHFPDIEQCLVYRQPHAIVFMPYRHRHDQECGRA